MNYGFTKKLSLSYEKALEKVREALSKEGFGVVADIDMAATLKDKLGIEHRPYRILGACNPPNALRALQAEEEIGLMLPCNVIVYSSEDGSTRVAAINPVVAMEPVKNEKLNEVAEEISVKLKRVIENL
ncbi:MAG: DUF302 domain-containing protein [Chlorobi bacterium]|nr:DUF302 domain-containing protein [Chlorobiota bacterium]